MHRYILPYFIFHVFFFNYSANDFFKIKIIIWKDIKSIFHVFFFNYSANDFFKIKIIIWKDIKSIFHY